MVDWLVCKAGCSERAACLLYDRSERAACLLSEHSERVDCLLYKRSEWVDCLLWDIWKFNDTDLIVNEIQMLKNPVQSLFIFLSTFTC